MIRYVRTSAGDVVEHQRRDDLVRRANARSRPGIAAQAPPASAPATHIATTMTRAPSRRPVAEVERDPDRGDRAEVELPLAADVVELHAERRGRGQAREHERRREDERRRERAVRRRTPRRTAAGRSRPGRARWRGARTRSGGTRRRSSRPGRRPSSQRGCSSRRSSLTRAPPGHQQPDLLDRRRLRVDLAHDLALVHDDDPVGERTHLVEVFADEEHRDALCGRLAQVVVHGLDRPTSSPRVGWRGERTRGAPSNSRPRTSFWRFPPDRFAAGVSGPGAFTSSAGSAAARLAHALAPAAVAPSRRARPIA